MKTIDLKTEPVRTFSIRTHIFLLMLAVSVPLVAIVGLGIYFDMQRSVAEFKKSLRIQVSTLAANAGGKIDNARLVLERMADRPLVKKVDPKNCDAALGDLLSLYPGYVNMAYSDINGMVVCSAVPLPGGKPANIGQTPWFQHFLKERRFTIGEPLIGPITNKLVSVLSVPIWSGQQKMVGAVHLPLDLKIFDPDASVQHLPADSRYGFFREDGVMIWRNHDPEGVIGGLVSSDAVQRIVEVRDGEFYARAADGVTGFYSVVPMPSTGWIAYVGVPAASVYAAANQRAWTGAAAALLVIILLFLLAIALVRRITGPVADLEAVARAVHGGDAGVRAALAGPREIAAVAQEFNTLIDAQQRSNTQLRIAATAFESQEGMLITDANGLILRVNRSLTKSSGYTADEIVGKSPRLLRSGRYNADFYRAMWAHLKRTGGWQGEIWDRRKDGEEYLKWLTISAVKDDHGGVTHYVGTHFDMTERKQGELALAAARRHTAVLAQLGRQLGEAATPKAAAIHILDAAQQLLGWDAGWLHLTDERQRHKVDLVYFDRIDGDIREVFSDVSAVSRPTPMASRVMLEGPQLVLRDAESDADANATATVFGSGRLCLSLMFVPIKLAGRLIGIVSIQSYRRHAYNHADLDLFHDLATHCAGALVRLQSIEALRQSEERFQLANRAVFNVIWDHDVLGDTTWWSEHLEKIYGHRVDEAAQTNEFWRNHIHPEDLDRVVAGVKALRDSHADNWSDHYRFRHKNGLYAFVEDRAFIIRDAAGHPLRLLGAIHDITDRKQAEIARASLETQLRESQKMEAIGTLAGGIAHDFNNILATILGNAELARQDVRANSPALESIDEIRKAASRARDLVQQILSFSRRQPTEFKLMPPAAVIEESVRLLRATFPARVVIELDCEAGLPAVLADATQIEQVVINLATNAMQALQGKPGRIGIRLDTVMLDAPLAASHPALRAMHTRHPGRVLRLAVSDDGMGMDEATLARIFEPFFTTKPVDEGTGLGLSVVHGIIQAHGGAIAVDSHVNTGSTFAFYLPVFEAEAGMTVPEPDANQAAPAADPATVNAGHILYIDDDESLVFLIKRLLERRGFCVSGHTDQRQALEQLRHDPFAFDLVVTDYNMPGMSGLDVAREVHAIRAGLPVAVASGFIDETLHAQAAAAGVRELIFKANAVEDLCEAFARLAQTGVEKPPPP